MKRYIFRGDLTNISAEKEPLFIAGIAGSAPRPNSARAFTPNSKRPNITIPSEHERPGRSGRSANSGCGGQQHEEDKGAGGTSKHGIVHAAKAVSILTNKSVIYRVGTMHGRDGMKQCTVSANSWSVLSK